jgi:regulation of enolase protein 1 (concanavalin A-like superfamily)
MEYFELKAGPNTDLWRKPPNGDTSTAPIVFTSLRHPFVVAEVTVSADWEMEWDQGGLVIFAGAAPQSFSSDTNTTPTGNGLPSTRRSSAQPCKWVKAGMEFSSGTVNASSVSATADGADWCLSPLAQGVAGPAIQSLRIKLERVGHALWIWYQIPLAVPYALSPGAVGGTWKKLREVTWFFYGVEDKFVHVGVYASRPTNIARGQTMWDAMHGLTLESTSAAGSSDGLVVEFEDLEIF